MKESYRHLFALIIFSLSFGCEYSLVIRPNTFPTYVEKDGVSLSINSSQSSSIPLPAPFITISIPAPGQVRLALYNSTGYEIKVLLDEFLNAGTKVVYYELNNSDGKPLKTGIYIFEAVFKDETFLRLEYFSF